jgi:Cu+-exporting ATPase
MSTLLEHPVDVKTGKAGEPNAVPERLEALKDPVCGMAVTAEASHHLEHEGRPYYFCSAGCQSKFAADPSRYIAKMTGPDAPATTPGSSAPSNAQPAAAIYTCPMHPEIRQDHPGNCRSAA